MEEKIYDILGIDKPEIKKVDVLSTENEKKEMTNDASKGLSNAATFCDIMLWLCVAMASIAGIVYLSNVGDLHSYSDYKRIDAASTCTIAGAYFSYGIIGAISSYITSKLLRGIGVIAKAAEQYLSVINADKKEQPTKDADTTKQSD